MEFSDIIVGKFKFKCMKVGILNAFGFSLHVQE